MQSEEDDARSSDQFSFRNQLLSPSNETLREDRAFLNQDENNIYRKRKETSSSRQESFADEIDKEMDFVLKGIEKKEVHRSNNESYSKTNNSLATIQKHQNMSRVGDSIPYRVMGKSLVREISQTDSKSHKGGKENDETMEELQKENKALKQKLELKTSQFKTILNEMKECQSALQSDSTFPMVNQLSKEIKRVMEERNSIRSDIALYENENTRLQEELEELQNLKNELAAQKEEYEKNYKETNSQNELLQSQLKELRDSMVVLNPLREQNAVLTNQLQEVKTVSDDLKNRNQALFLDKQGLEKRLKEEQEKLKDLSKSVENLNSRLIEKDFENKEKDQLIESLNQKLGLQTRTLHNYEQLFNMGGGLNNSFSKELTYSKENTLEQESNFNDVRYEHFINMPESSLCGNIDYKLLYETRTQELNQIKEETLKEKLNLEQELEDSVATLKEKINFLKFENEKLKAEKHQVISEKELKEKTIRTLEAALKRSETEICRYKEEDTDSRKELYDLRMQNDFLQQRIENITGELHIVKNMGQKQKQNYAVNSSEDSQSKDESSSGDVVQEIKKMSNTTFSKIRLFFSRLRKDATGYPSNWKEDFCEFHYEFQNSRRNNFLDGLGVIFEFLAECLSQIEIDFHCLEKSRGLVEQRNIEIKRTSEELEDMKHKEKKMKINERVVNNELGGLKENRNSNLEEHTTKLIKADLQRYKAENENLRRKFKELVYEKQIREKLSSGQTKLEPTEETTRKEKDLLQTIVQRLIKMTPSSDISDIVSFILKNHCENSYVKKEKAQLESLLSCSVADDFSSKMVSVEGSKENPFSSKESEQNKESDRYPTLNDKSRGRPPSFIGMEKDFLKSKTELQRITKKSEKHQDHPNMELIRETLKKQKTIPPPEDLRRNSEDRIAEYTKFFEKKLNPNADFHNNDESLLKFLQNTKKETLNQSKISRSLRASGENRPRSVGRPSREKIKSLEPMNTSFATYTSLKDKLERQRTSSFYGDFV